MSSPPENRRWARPRKLKGLGDVVAIAAKPLAGLVDAVAGTQLRNCQGCARRQEDWNRRFPFG